MRYRSEILHTSFSDHEAVNLLEPQGVIRETILLVKVSTQNLELIIIQGIVTISEQTVQIEQLKHIAAIQTERLN